MENKNATFSIIVPVYNAEEFLDACIASVLGQTDQDYELILVNDGSKDGSGAICDRYAEQYENIVAFHKENAGQLHTREYGIGKASGEYCVFLDSDDTLQLNALETIRKKIQQHNCDCLIYQLQRVRDGKVLSREPEFEDECITDKRVLYKKCLLSSVYNSMCRKAIKTQILKANVDYTDAYSVQYGEDLVQTLYVLKYSQKVAFVDDVLYNYTYNPKSMMNSINCNATVRIAFAAYEQVVKFLQAENVWTEEDHLEFKSYCAHLLMGRALEICRNRISFAEKRKEIKNIRQGEFFQGYMIHTPADKLAIGKRSGLYRLFQKGHITPLIWILDFYWLRRRIMK